MTYFNYEDEEKPHCIYCGNQWYLIPTTLGWVCMTHIPRALVHLLTGKDPGDEVE